MKILIVEDDPFLSEMLIGDIKSLIGNGEIEIVGPSDSFSQAVELLKLYPVDVALLDITLHDDLNAGIRLAQYINQTRPIPILFLSGLPRNTGFDVAKYTAPLDFLHKPYNRQQLLDKLELAMVRQSHKRMSVNETPPPAYHPPIIYVPTRYNEITAIPLNELILLEADDKVIYIHLSSKEKPVVFTSPGLKNFFEENLLPFSNFYQLSRTYVINLGKVLYVRDNHVILPRPSSGVAGPAQGQNVFSIPIPQKNNAKKKLYAMLGKKG